MLGTAVLLGLSTLGGVIVGAVLGAVLVCAVIYFALKTFFG